MTFPPTPESCMLAVAADKLNVRQFPNLTSKVICILDQGAVVQRLDCSSDGYWQKIRFNGRVGWAAYKYLQSVFPETPESPFRWLQIAFGEQGTAELSATAENPRIQDYLASTTLDKGAGRPDETRWCSAFVNWCVEKAGHAGTDSAWARSWNYWGRATYEPVPGCIAVFSRDEEVHYVGFYLSRDEQSVRVLGANRSDRVGITRYPVERLVGFRVPA